MYTASWKKRKISTYMIKSGVCLFVCLSLIWKMLTSPPVFKLFLSIFGVNSIFNLSKGRHIYHEDKNSVTTHIYQFRILCFWACLLKFHAIFHLHASKGICMSRHAHKVIVCTLTQIMFRHTKKWEVFLPKYDGIIQMYYQFGYIYFICNLFVFIVI